MTRHFTHSITGALLFLLSLYHGSLLAAPVVQICVEANCRDAIKVEISTQTWGDVKEIFATPFPSDKDELDNIIIAFQLLRLDIYQSLENNNSLDLDAQSLYAQQDANTHYKNARHLLALMLDQYFITRHYLRKTIKQRKWYSFGQNVSDGLLMQSIDNGQQYLFKINRELLSLSPVIDPVKP
ncbi:MAG TPA: hypothetical protein VIQ81_08865 [Gammaproteobacteria bacterium]